MPGLSNSICLSLCLRTLKGRKEHLSGRIAQHWAQITKPDRGIIRSFVLRKFSLY